MLHLSVAVLTTGQRPADLKRCLAGFVAMQPAAGVTWRLVLVSNGTLAVPAGVAALAVQQSMPVTVLHESMASIPRARNRAITDALAQGSDYLAFVDDDAVPDSDWLLRITEAIRRTGADAVTGPQLPVFPEDSPARLRRAAVFQAREFPRDEPCRWAASNNVMFSLAFVERKGLRFDETFATGGSDKAFFLRFAAAGGVIRWEPEAIVREPVVRGRLSLRWAVARSWRMGTTGFRIESSVREPRAAFLVCLGKGMAYIGLGAVRLPGGVAPGSPGFVDGLCYMVHGAGFMLGVSPRLRVRRYF